MTDPVADMLIRIKNGYQAKKKIVSVPYSKMKEEIAKILVKEGYLKNVQRPKTKDKKLALELTLEYKDKEPVLRGVKRISRPGLRIYASQDKIPESRYGLGTVIVSTSQGIMVGRQAKKRKIGGEVICQVW